MLIKRPRKWVKNRVLSTLDFCGFAGFLHMSLYTPSFLSFAGEPFVLTRRVYHISLSHLKLLYLPQFRSPALSHKKRRRLLLQFSAKTTASGWLPCSNSVTRPFRLQCCLLLLHCKLYLAAVTGLTSGPVTILLHRNFSKIFILTL